jgi:uncharacterized protein (TIGR00251 family)
MVHLRVRVTAGARRDEIVGWQGDVLRVRVAAAPERGKANDSLVRLIARSLSVGRSQVRILRGATARDKLLLVEDLNEAEIRARLSPSR